MKSTRKNSPSPRERRTSAAISVQPIPTKAPRASLALVGTLTWAYLILLILGFVVFRTPGTLVRGNEMSRERAAFVVINAGTLTGFQLNLAIDQYKWPGQWMILILTVGGTLFALIAGGIAVSRILGFPYSDWQIIAVSMVVQIIVALVGALIGFRSDDSIFAGIFQSVSAFGNSGVWLGARPLPGSAPLHAFFLPLAMLGGLGIPVILDIGAAMRGKRKLSRHSVVVLSVTALLFLISVAAIFGFQRWEIDSKTAYTPTLAVSSAAAVNSRTAGIPLQMTAQLARSSQWIVLMMMAIGASPGGTGGGLKTTTPAVLLRGIGDILSGKAPGRILGIAATWIILYGALVLTSLLWLLHSEPDLEPDRLLFLATSAASNVGLSHSPVAMVGSGSIVLSITMLLGRLLPLVILWWAAMTVRDADIAVG